MELTDVAHDLSVPPRRLLGHVLEAGRMVPAEEHPLRLRVQHERHREEALDPFCKGDKSVSKVIL